MKNPLLAIIILFSAYAFGQNGSVETPKIGVKVALGATVELEGVAIKFLEVLEDSRCPKDVSCIWAGRAIVKAEVTAKGKTEEKKLFLGEVRPGEEANTIIYTSKDFSIKGLTLNPYPTTKSSEAANYVLLISKEKNQ